MRNRQSTCAESAKASIVIVLGAWLCGCASIGIGPDSIREKTAMTLRLADNAFTISDRVDTPARSTYTASTTRGKKYSCYVISASKSPDGVASNAICAEVSAPTNSAMPTPPKAANRDP
jgi:hypothetical protein